jgi:hypothetical protein
MIQLATFWQEQIMVASLMQTRILLVFGLYPWGIFERVLAILLKITKNHD